MGPLIAPVLLPQGQPLPGVFGRKGQQRESRVDYHVCCRFDWYSRGTGFFLVVSGNLPKRQLINAFAFGRGMQGDRWEHAGFPQ